VIRVLIVDDHQVVRQGLRFMLEQEEGIEVVGDCADGTEAIAAVRELRPTVVLLDLFLPGQDGISVLTQLKQERPEVEVLMLTSSTDDEHLLAALRAGALAYLRKTAGVEQIIGSVRAAARGESVLDPRIAARLVREVRTSARRRAPLDLLSPREREVLTVLARGRSNRQIAKELAITEETVKAHVSSILAKLHLADRTQAAIFGLQQRLVPSRGRRDDPWQKDDVAARHARSPSGWPALGPGSRPTASSCLDRGDVDLLHLHHRIERALGSSRIGVRDRLRQRDRGNLPGQSPFVLAPAARALLAAVADDRVPVTICFVLVSGGDLKRECFVVLEHRSAVEPEAGNPHYREFDRQHVAHFPVRKVSRRAHHRADG